MPSLKSIVAFCLLLSFTVCAESETQKEGSHPILAILNIANLDNPTIKKAGKLVDISRNSLRSSRSAFLPKIGSRAEYNHEKDKGKTAEDLRRYPLIRAELSQTIFDMPSYFQYQESKQLLKESHHTQESFKQRIYKDVCSLYLNTLRTYRLIELAKTNNGLSYEHLNSTRQRYSGGELTKNEVRQAETRFLVSKTVLAESQNQSKLSELRFLEIMGIAFPKDARLFRINMNEPDLSKALKKADITNNPGYHQILSSLDKQKQRVKRFKHYYWPKAKFSASTQRNFDTTVLGVQGPLDESVLKVELTFDHFNGGKNISEYLIAKSELEAIELDKEIYIRKTLRELSEALDKLKLHEELQKTLDKAVEAATEAMTGIKKEYLAGTKTSINLMDAQNELFAVQTQKLNSRINLTLTQLDILLILGLLDIETMKEIVLDG